MLAPFTLTIEPRNLRLQHSEVTVWCADCQTNDDEARMRGRASEEVAVAISRHPDI